MYIKYHPTPSNNVWASRAISRWMVFRFMSQGKGVKKEERSFFHVQRSSKEDESVKQTDKD